MELALIILGVLTCLVVLLPAVLCLIERDPRSAAIYLVIISTPVALCAIVNSIFFTAGLALLFAAIAGAANIIVAWQRTQKSLPHGGREE